MTGPRGTRRPRTGDPPPPQRPPPLFNQRGFISGGGGLPPLEQNSDLVYLVGFYLIFTGLFRVGGVGAGGGFLLYFLKKICKRQKKKSTPPPPSQEKKQKKKGTRTCPPPKKKKSPKKPFLWRLGGGRASPGGVLGKEGGAVFPPNLGRVPPPQSLPLAPPFAQGPLGE